MRAKVDERLRFVEVALLEPGKPFGPWEVEYPVGQGGFGAVYRARDPRLGRTIALKVMLEDDADDPESVARFLREARLAAALEHPNVVRIHDVGTIAETPYIAMEWIEGTTLGRAKVERPVELLTTIAETLAFAHERGIVHRDLKPSNVMVDRHGRPTLVDFGIAKRVGAAAPTFATRDGVVLGTPNYMAPEQELTSAVDARADQWAWAAIAYELITGDRPTRPALAHAALDDRLAAVLLRALAIAPSERYPSMRELLAAWKAASVPQTTPPARPLLEPPPRSKTRLFFATASVTVVAGLWLVLAMPARSPTPVASTPKAPRLEELTEASLDASNEEADADVDADVDAEAVAARPKAAAKPTGVRALGEVVIVGSASVDRSAVLPQLRASRGAFERCIVGMPLPPRGANDEIVVRLRFRESEEVIMDWFEPARGWPPATVRTCVGAVIRKLKVVANLPNKDAFINLVLELRR